MTQNNNTVIELINVNKSYKMGEQSLHVLKNINLTINAGEYISIMGPSGSGKSTLLNMIGMLDRPDNGQYLLNQNETATLEEENRASLRRDNIGFIFQNFHLISRLTAAENAELPLMLASIDAKKRREKSLEIFDKLNIRDRADHLPNQLSGGQMQRVAIARAMIMAPQILLADEPTGNLDQQSGQEVLALLEDLNRQGITLLMVTHDKSLGRRANRQITMVDGEITADTRNYETAR